MVHNPSSKKACKNEPPQCLVLQKKDTNVKKVLEKKSTFYMQPYSLVRRYSEVQAHKVQ